MMPSRSRRSTVTLLATAATLALLAAGPAHAFDANALGDRLKALYVENGGTLDWASMDTNGSTVELHGVTATVKGLDDPLELGDVTLAGVSDTDTGGYRVDTVSVPQYAYSANGIAFTASNLSVAGLELPGTSDGDSAPWASYDRMQVDTMSVTWKGSKVAEVDGARSVMNRDKDQARYEFSGGIDSFSADLSQIENEKAKPILRKLGYEKIEGSADVHGSWALKDGDLVVDRYAVDVKTAGKLGLTFKIGGYTPEFLKSLRDLQTSMNGQKDQAKGLAMLGLMQQLEIGGISIRFDDASLTGKLLDFYAHQMGSSRAALVSQIKGMLPVALARLGNPTFAAQVTTAVGTFLDNPKSIEIRAAPNKPVPVAILAATGMAQPQTLPDTLGVTVAADQ